jgi:hypothetical protein
MAEPELRRILKQTLGLRWYGEGGTKLPLLHQEILVMLRASAALDLEVVGRPSSSIGSHPIDDEESQAGELRV